MAKEADTTFQEVFSQASWTDLIKLLPQCVSSAVPLHYMSKALTTTVWQEEDVPVTITVPMLEDSQALNPSDSPAGQTGTPPLPMPPFLDIPFVDTFLVWHPFAGFSAGPIQKMWNHSSSDILSDQCNKRTHIDSQEVEVWIKHSSTQDNENSSKLVPEDGSSPKPQGLEPTGSLSSPTKATADPDDGIVVGTSRSTRDQDSESDANHSGALSDSGTSRENVAESDMESASGDCIMCSDTDEVTIRTACKEYRKRVWTSCSLGKGSLWSEAQLKCIGDSHQAVWGHDHEIVRTAWDDTLEEDWNSFEMHKMLVRTDQLICIAETTNSKIYAQGSEAEAHGWAKILVL